jgi:transposase
LKDAVSRLADYRSRVTVEDRSVGPAAGDGVGSSEMRFSGPVVAAIVLGHVVDVSRFPTRGHFASYAGVAPIEASSGPKKRHRLNPRGNRQLNHALHIIAIAQISHDSAGRVYYDRKITEAKPRKNRCAL